MKLGWFQPSREECEVWLVLGGVCKVCSEWSISIFKCIQG